MQKPIFICQQCGFASGKWHGRCPSCDAWDSLVEEASSPARRKSHVGAPEPVPYPDVASADLVRTSTDLPEFDRVLGGGLVPGGVVLWAASPGSEKARFCSNPHRRSRTGTRPLRLGRSPPLSCAFAEPASR